MVNRGRLDAHVEASQFATRKRDDGVGENRRVVVREVERRRPVLRHAGHVERVRVGDEVGRTWRRVVDGEVVHRLLAGFNDVVVGLADVQFDINLTSQDVRIADGEAVVVGFVAAFVRVRPRNVRAASQVVGKGRRHADGGLAAVLWSELVRVPAGHGRNLPWVDGRQAVAGEVGAVQAGVDHFFTGGQVTRVDPGDVDVVLVVGQEGGEDRVAAVWAVLGQPRPAFNVGNRRVVDLLDGVGGQALVGAVPRTRALQAQLGVVDLVIDLLLEAVVTPVHPCDVGVALQVHADGGVEGVGVIDGHAGVVDHDKVAVGTGAGVLNVAVADHVGALVAGRPLGVVVHLPVGVEDAHVDLTGVVGGNVDHRLDEEVHVVARARGELVDLTARIGVANGAAGAVSCLLADHAVRALGEVAEVGLHGACATVALAVETNRNDTRGHAVVVGFLDGGTVVCTGRWVAVLGALVRDGDGDLGGVGVPLVVRGRGRVAGHVAQSVLPREAGPVRPWTPVFTGVSGVGVAVVDGLRQHTQAAGIVAVRGAERGVAGTLAALVVGRAVAGLGDAGQGVAEPIDGLVDRHVGVGEHRLDAAEVTAAGKVAAVDDGAHVGPLGVHRTGGVDDEHEFDLATTGVVPGDLDVVVGVHNDVGVALVSDDRRQQGVVEERQRGASGHVGLDHGVVDLGLREELVKRIVGVLPHDVKGAHAVDVNGGPVAVLRALRDDGVIDGGDGAVGRGLTVTWRLERLQSGVHDGVLTGSVGPHDVHGVVLVDHEVGVRNLVETRIADLGGVNHGLAAR